MFVDIAKIELKAGNGGDGAVSFHREKYIASGGPDGGDGGRGGDIIFKADTNLSTLADFKYKKKHIAKNGENGKPNRQTGKSAKDLIIKVPMGTIIKDEKTGAILVDISDDKPRILAKGGKGGLGNSHFASSTRQIPRFAKPGMLGESLTVQLELKLLADVGLVGFPNVGKSTLISVVSTAKPQIANYHFTTIVPNLGIVTKNDISFVMADIPGIIEGASQGIGLGHQFLRHIERCRLLVHIVDISGSEGRNPIEDFNKIMKELKAYDIELEKKPMIVAGNKCDLATEEQIEEFKNYIEKLGFKYFSIKAFTNWGVDLLINEVIKELSNLPPIIKYKEEVSSEKPKEMKAEKNYDISIKKQNDTYFVEGEWIIELMRSINFGDYESLRYFDRVLNKTGVIKKLKEAGLVEGEYVNIYDMEFEYFD